MTYTVYSIVVGIPNTHVGYYTKGEDWPGDHEDVKNNPFLDSDQSQAIVSRECWNAIQAFIDEHNLRDKFRAAIGHHRILSVKPDQWIEPRMMVAKDGTIYDT